MNKFFTSLAVVAMAASPLAATASDASDAIFANYVSNPAENAVISSFNGQYHIGFPDADVVEDNSEEPQYECVLKNETTGKTYELQFSMPSDVAGSDNNGHYFNFVMGETITEKGDYTVTFPVGAFLYKGEKSPEFVTHFTIGDAPVSGDAAKMLSEWVADPADGDRLESLKEITITFPLLGEDYWIQGPYSYDESENSGGYVTLTDSKGKEYEISAFTEDYKAIKLKVAKDFLPDGNYTVTVTRGLFYLEEPDDYIANLITFPEDIVINYTIGDVSGVDTVAAAETVTVSDLLGRTLLRDAAPEALRQLPAGLYIVNGVKTLLK